MPHRSHKKSAHKPVPFYESWGFIIVLCVVLPLLLRSFVFSPFHIPSGSMKATLLEGDFIFVSKYAYGFSRYSFPFSPNLFKGRILAKTPQRGDVIVFRLPTDPKIDYIKRLIGLPGDRIQVREGVLYINGAKIPKTYLRDFVDQVDGNSKTLLQFEEVLPEGKHVEILDETPDGPLDNTQEYLVPDGHYFFMGDNRDNSQDSRVTWVVGYVPEENLVGRAEIIFLSTSGRLWKFWTWLDTIRGERFLKVIN